MKNTFDKLGRWGVINFAIGIFCIWGGLNLTPGDFLSDINISLGVVNITIGIVIVALRITS